MTVGIMMPMHLVIWAESAEIQGVVITAMGVTSHLVAMHGKCGEVGMTVERMIELLEIEKECVLRNASGGCNRYCAGCDLLQDDTELHEMYTETISLLKAQEPRVMDFDDVVGGDECWLEAINGACGYADCYACTGTGEVQVFRCNFDNPQYIMASDYLKTWRCWTSRPTDEQREAVKWE